MPTLRPYHAKSGPTLDHYCKDCQHRGIDVYLCCARWRCATCHEWHEHVPEKPA